MPETYSMRSFTEEVNGIVDRVLELSLLHDCRAYFLVESSSGIVTFNSEEDPLWPPDDRSLASFNRPLQRLYSSQEVLARATEAERKDLIQMLLYISEVANGPPDLEAYRTQEEQVLAFGGFEGSGADGQDEDRSIQEEECVDDDEEGEARLVAHEMDGDQEKRGHEAYIWSGDATDWYGSRF
ncbi:hypothetical protein BJX99DRAFT_234203 [Aspergillus californicus]